MSIAYLPEASARYFGKGTILIVTRSGRGVGDGLYKVERSPADMSKDIGTVYYADLRRLELLSGFSDFYLLEQRYY